MRAVGSNSHACAGSAARADLGEARRVPADARPGGALAAAAGLQRV